MSLFVNVPEEEAFRLITDFFASERMKILIASPPSHIRAEFGSWTSISLNNAKGEVEVEIKKGNGGSYVNLDFDFFKEYLFALMIAVFGTIGLCVIMWWRASADMPRINPADTGAFLFKVSLVTFGLSAFMFIVAIGLVGYSIALTKRRHTGEFTKFIQSFSKKV